MVSFLTGMGLLRSSVSRGKAFLGRNGASAGTEAPNGSFFWLPWDFWLLNADETVESPQHSLAFFSLWDCTGGKRAESGGKQAGDWKRVRQKSQDGVFFNRNGAFSGNESRDG